MYFIFVLPAKNEEATIKDVIDNISNKIDNEHKISFIIISDSSDKTDDIVSKLENVKLYSGQNFGLGYSIFKGVKLASKLNPDYIFIVDSDGQVDLEEIKKRIEKKEDIIGRDDKFKKIEINNDYPNYILKNIDKLEEWIV